MSAWLTIGFLVALIGAQAYAETVRPDFAENVNTRLGASRIVSGWEAELGMWPHQISMRMTNPLGQVSACGGSIIHDEWAMTAAHCTAGRVNVIVRAGLVNLTRPEYIFETNEWYNHPEYNDAIASVVQPHDISLLKLNRRIEFSPNLQPIRLQRSADMDRNYNEQQIIASGYGLTWTGGSSPEVLNWVYLRGITNFDCWVTYGFSSIVVDSTICAIYYNETSQSTCQGDSGGPLSIVEEDGKLSMVGVASFVSGQGCHTEHPAGFIRPGHYHPWYLEVTGINFDWDWEDSEEIEQPVTAEPPPVESEEDSREVPEVASPEVSEEDSSEVPEVASPEVSEEDSSEVPEVASPEVSEEDSSEVPEVASPEVSEEDSAEVPEVASPEVSDEDSSEVPEVASPEVSDEDSAEVPEVASPEVSEEEDSSEVPEVASPEVSEEDSSEVPEVASPEVSEEASSEEPEVASPESSQESSSEEPEVASPESSQESSSEETEESNDTSE